MKTILILIFFLFSPHVFTRTFDSYGIIPFISISKGLSTRTDLNFYHSDTFVLTERKFEGRKYPSRDQQTYFQTSISYKLFPNLNLALGHIYQRNNPLDVDFVNENRIFQQVTFSQTFDSVQVSHRLRYEQRFISERETDEYKTRFRYQIGANFPLQGRQLDPGEWYFNCYNEFYFSTSGERNAFYSDDWLYAGFGYQTLNWGKLEAGPIAQYSVINRDKDYRSLYSLQFGWILKFK